VEVDQVEEIELHSGGACVAAASGLTNSGSGGGGGGQDKGPENGFPGTTQSPGGTGGSGVIVVQNKIKQHQHIKSHPASGH
jgi:hypothetical protein